MKKKTVRFVPLLAGFLLAGSLEAQTSIIPQVVDGGGIFQTIVSLTNTSASPTVVSLTFFQNTSGGATSAWNLTFTENVQLQSIILAGGTTLFLHTHDTAASITVGWGQVNELDGAGSVVAYAVFTQRGNTLGVGTAPASTAVSRILAPFDNTNSAVTSLAIANPTNSTVTINVGIRTASATTQPTAITLPALGHTSFDFPSQFGAAVTGQSGLAEFYSPSGNFAILALRFQSGALTTSPVFSATGPPLIASSSSGGGGGGTSGNITFAGFSVGKINTTGGSFTASSQGMDLVGGQFASYTPTEWNLPFSAQTIGPCTVLDVTYSGTKVPYGADNYFDAGTIALSGANIPAGAVLLKISTPSGPVYNYSPPAGTLQLGSAYTISSTGGPQVNGFNTTSTPLPSAFAVTNWDAITSINRANGLTVNWTGAGFDQVILSAGGTTIGASIHSVTVSCVVSGSSGTFSFPQQALALLPAVQSGDPTSIGQLSVSVGTAQGGQVSPVSGTPTSFTPTLVGGGKVDYGSFTSFLGVVKSSLSIQ